ncbi:MAG: isomerizing glutamine--fructose-6-phosphate transaminase, partial [Thermodesulfovibrionales bacterium]
IEELASVPVEVDIASEFRYRRPLISRDDLFVAISQSGETADTLAALREAKRLGARTLVICNVLGSSAARESDAVFYTHSGPEIGVASTKAFLTQIASLFLLAVALGRERGTLGEEEAGGLLTALKGIPGKVEAVLAQDETILNVARSVFKASDFLYLARGILYPVALEGALKLKEISYIHAEGYAAGEMKHGPIALVDESLPVVFLASQGILLDKMISNMNEIRSRGGRSIVVADGVTEVLGDVAESVITVPGTNKYLLPLVMTVPLQLLAYHVGVLRGCDVDQPRNLAKSVTVE